MTETGSDIALLEADSVPQLTVVLDRAKSTLASARSAAEILEAREAASFVYDAAKRASRLAKAKQANDDVAAAMLRLQADANEAIAASQRRLADEYDAAQERGEVGQSGARTDLVSNGNEVPPSASDLGLSRKEIHDARVLRDAEKAEPGVTRKALDKLVERGLEPNKAALKRELKAEAQKARDAENDANRARRQEAIDSLPVDVRQSMAAREAHRASKRSAGPVEVEQGALTPADRLAELEDAVAYLEGENARLNARLVELQHLEAMELLYLQGGFDAILAAKDETLATKDAILGMESAEKVRAQRSAKFWRKKAIELGYSDTLIIDVGGDVVGGQR